MFRRASLNQFSFLPTYFTPNFSVIVMGVLRRQLTFVCLILAIISVGLTAQSAEIRPWQEYRTIMWVGDTAYKNPGKLGLFYQRLREMGINTAMVHGDGDIKPILDNKFPYYVENMVNRGLCLKFSSKVTDWDKFVTDWVRNGRPESALVRDYCLDSTEWQSWARKEIQQLARKNRDRNPVAYNIRDELSTTISANPFDYDFNPIALSGFRSWLKTQYADVAALNAEWETKFRDWDEVKPFTTDEIKEPHGQRHCRLRAANPIGRTPGRSFRPG